MLLFAAAEAWRASAPERALARAGSRGD
jgi:hypothetical protein